VESIADELLINGRLAVCNSDWTQIRQADTPPENKHLLSDSDGDLKAL
jgi:hypothetical protein